MAKDVVCGMEVDPLTAKAQSSYDGECYHFCCPGCRATFDRNPTHYLRAAALSEGLDYSANLAQQAGYVEASRELSDWSERLYEPCEQRRAQKSNSPSPTTEGFASPSELWLG